MADTATDGKDVAAKETFEILMEISKLLNTGLDTETLSLCVRLCERGVNPEALATIVKSLKTEASTIKNGEDK